MANEPHGKNHRAGDELKLLFERIQRLQLEIQELQADVKDVFNEAKSRGYDVKTMKNVLKILKMERHVRRETFGLIELYLAAIGEGDGSLSDQARAFLEERKSGGLEPEDEEAAEEEAERQKRAASGSTKAVGDGKEGEQAPAPPPLTVQDATRMGMEASQKGVPVTANPFQAGDPRRAAWDIAWCGAAGSDGMEIPEFLRPKKPDPKK